MIQLHLLEYLQMALPRDLIERIFDLLYELFHILSRMALFYEEDQ